MCGAQWVGPVPSSVYTQKQTEEMSDQHIHTYAATVRHVSSRVHAESMSAHGLVLAARLAHHALRGDHTEQKVVMMTHMATSADDA